MAKINKYWGLVAVGALTAAAAGAIAAIISRKSVCEDDFEDDFDDLYDLEEDEKKEEKEEIYKYCLEKLNWQITEQMMLSD